MSALVRMTAGLIAWAAAFSLLYALHGFGCAGGWPQAGVHRGILVATWLAAIAGTALLAIRLAKRGRDTLIDRSAAALGWAGCAATLICGLPLVLVPPCV